MTSPALLLVTGFLSILGQVVLLRELAVAFYGVELAYLLALGAWLLATAAGAAASGRGHPSRQVPGAILAACALVLPLCVLFVRRSRILFGAVPGAFLPPGQQLAVMVIGVAPVAALLGLLFQRAARARIAAGTSAAAAYALESAGGLAGGLAATLALRAGVSNMAQAFACATMAALGAILLLPRGPMRRIGGVTVAGLALAAAAGVPALDRATTRWAHPALVDVVDSPYGRIAIAARGAQVTVFQDDRLAVETESTDAEVLAHLGMLQHPAPRTVLVLGGTIAGVPALVLRHGATRVDAVEIDPTLTEAALPHLAAATRAAASDPRVHVVFDDPRRFLHRATARYDVILSSMPEPASGQANRFYTREFFQEAAAHLAPGGVFAFRLRGAENYWTPAILRTTGSVYRALTAVFPGVAVLPGASNVFLAFNRLPVPDVAEVVARLRARSIAARLVSPPFVHYLYTNDRFEEVASALRDSHAPMNTDARPICYHYASVAWLSMLLPRLAAIDPSFGEAGVPMPVQAGVALAFAALLVAARRVARLTALVLVAASGGIGMVLETTILLHYQLKNGVVYQDLGLLLMAVMAGLAGGAIVMDRLVRRHGTPGRRLGAALAGGFGALGGGVALAVASGRDVGLAEACMLLGVTGFFIAGLFAYAALRRPDEQATAIGPLYAADVAGGAAGSLAATLVLLPLGGLVLTADWMAAMALALLVLI